MAAYRYIPYHQAYRTDDSDLIVCDCYYHRGLNLTHLYSDRVPIQYRSNTSTETVLKWLADTATDKPSIEATSVTCNHWDIDGFLSVWSILNSEAALRSRNSIIAAAHLGDFREFDHRSEIGIQALKICCLLNCIEAKEFCLPFGDLEDATIEYQVSVKKFEYFLPRFSTWLEHIENFRDVWKAEFDEVLSDIERIENGDVVITEYRSPNISVIKTDTPLHYYAAFSKVHGGAVLTEITRPHYLEFEYRYETAVGRLDKPVIERLDLTSIVSALNAIEQTPGVRWTFDNINEGGSTLRPEFIDKPLSREEKYQSMEYRIGRGLTPTTSIDAETLLGFITDHYKTNEHPSGRSMLA